MSERIGSAQNQNIDAGSEDMALLSDNLARLQGEVSAFRKQLADSHQDWEQIKSQLLKRTEDTMKAFIQIKVETHNLLSLQEQFQQELHRLKSLKATHRHIFIQKPEGNSPPHLYLPRIPVDAVSGQRSRSDTFSFRPQCLAVQAQPQHVGQ